MFGIIFANNVTHLKGFMKSETKTILQYYHNALYPDCVVIFIVTILGLISGGVLRHHS